MTFYLCWVREGGTRNPSESSLRHFPYSRVPKSFVVDSSFDLRSTGPRRNSVSVDPFRRLALGLRTSPKTPSTWTRRPPTHPEPSLPGATSTHLFLDDSSTRGGSGGRVPTRPFPPPWSGLHKT